MGDFNAIVVVVLVVVIIGKQRVTKEEYIEKYRLGKKKQRCYQFLSLSKNYLPE